MIIELADGADERLADYTRPTDVALRRRLETQRGLHMVEFSKIIARAVAVRRVPCSLLMASRHLEEMHPVIASVAGCGGSDDGDEIPVFVAPEEIPEPVMGFHLHCGALAAMNRPEFVGVPELLSPARGRTGAKWVAILEGLVDHTNVGVAFRSAAALGTDAVLIVPRCADPLYRRSVCIFMGTVFQVPWTRIERRPATDELHVQGFIVAALTLSDASAALDEFAASSACTASDLRVAVVLGTEGDELFHRIITVVDEVVRIPMAGGMDSPNVAVAAAVVFWASRLPWPGLQPGATGSRRTSNRRETRWG